MAIAVTGTVAQIYPDPSGTYIKLNGLRAADTPKNGLFHLKLSHPNYNALYSLALAAAVNRLVLQIRIDGDNPINPSGDYPSVLYMTTSW